MTIPYRIIAVALILFLPACSEDPTLLTSLDTKFTDADIVVIEDTLEAISASSYRQVIPMNGFHSMLGRNGPHEARMAIQFTAGITERDTVNVLSAALRLRAVTWAGDSTGMFDFTAHKILRAWSSLTLTWDTISSGGFYEEGVVRGSFSGTMTADTEYVTIDLDTSMVRQWLRPSVEAQYGVALVSGPATSLLRGFTVFGTDDSVQFLPTLTVIARNVAGTVTDTTEYTIGNDTFGGNVDNLISDPGRIYVQAGVVYRTRLLFNASPIPPGAIVNQADLLLWLDESASRIGRFSGDTLVAAHVSTSLTDSTRFETEGAIARVGTAGAYLFDSRRTTQLAVNGTNNGVILRATSLNEFSTLDLFVYHGPATSMRQFRPRVRVLYSIESRNK